MNSNDRKKQMELIDRTFRPGLGSPFLPLLFGFIAIGLFGILLGSSLASYYPSLEYALGVVFNAYAAAAISFLAILMLLRIRLYSDGSSLNATILFIGLPIYRRSVEGVSWHAIARPGGMEYDSVGTGSYRIEVSTEDGYRISFLGSFACWLFQIHCL